MIEIFISHWFGKNPILEPFGCLDIFYIQTKMDKNIDEAQHLALSYVRYCHLFAIPIVIDKTQCLSGCA